MFETTIRTSALRAALHCAPVKPDVRFYLNGVLFDYLGDGRAALVATDGQVLFAGVLDAPCDQTAPFQIIIPMAAVKAAVKTKAPELALCAMVDGRYLLGDQVFAPIDGRYPDYRRVIPAPDAVSGKVALFDPKLLVRVYAALAGWHESKAPIECITMRHNGAVAAPVYGPDDSAVAVTAPYRDPGIGAYKGLRS